MLHRLWRRKRRKPQAGVSRVFVSYSSIWCLGFVLLRLRNLLALPTGTVYRSLQVVYYVSEVFFCYDVVRDRLVLLSGYTPNRGAMEVAVYCYAIENVMMKKEGRRQEE